MLSLVRNARVFAPADQGVCDLVIADRRIAYLGREVDDLPAWCDDTTVDLRGRIVVPALVDGHVHVTGGGGEAGFGSRILPLAAQVYRAAGTGTVVGLLGTDDTTRTIESLVAWTRELNAHGVTARCFTGGYHVPPRTLTGSVRGDLVWIDVIIGVGELAISDHRSSHPSVAELLRIASDAHVGGLITGKAGVLHLHLGDGPAGLEPIRRVISDGDLPPRVFHPSHVNRRKALFEESIAFAAAGSTIDITAFPLAEGEDAWSAPDALARYLESDAPAERVTVSSDGGGCLPVFTSDGAVASYDVAAPAALLGALRDTVAAGLDLATTLPAFTTNPARLLRLAGKGELACGSAADFLVLEEDLNLHAAMYGGAWYDANGRPKDTAAEVAQ